MFVLDLAFIRRFEVGFVMLCADNGKNIPVIFWNHDKIVHMEM